MIGQERFDFESELGEVMPQYVIDGLVRWMESQEKPEEAVEVAKEVLDNINISMKLS